MDREAMKQPEALLLADALDDEFLQGRISNHNGRKAAVELRRLHEALEIEQEPVAWMHNFIEGNVITHIPADIVRHPERWTPLYTAPPKKEWQGLTLEEREHLRDQYESSVSGFISAIEAKLREKNHG